MRPDRKEIYRYLGYKGAEPDEATEALIDECESEIIGVSQLKHVTLMVPLAFGGADEDIPVVSLGSMKVASRALFRNLHGCSEAVMFAATIGLGADRLIKRAQLTSMVRTAVLQAVGAAYVEAYCDEINKIISDEAAGRGLKTRMRFSPGYGDFALSHQPAFLAMLNAENKTGITLTDGYLMVPSKSVTAVVGLCRQEEMTGENAL